MLVRNNAGTLGATVVSKVYVCADDGTLLSYEEVVKIIHRP